MSLTGQETVFASEREIQVQINSINQLDFITIKNGSYKPEEGNELYELTVDFINPGSSKSFINFESILLEGNGFTADPIFVGKDKSLPVSYLTSVKVNAGKFKSIKLYYEFPFQFNPANLVVGGKAIIELNGDLENEILLDDKNNPTTDIDKAKYKREVNNEQSRWYIKDFYYPGNTLQKEMYCSSIYPMIKQGRYVRYFMNGNIEKECVYSNNIEEGMIKTYYENGEQKSVGSRENYSYKYHHYYDDEGVDLLTKGNGEFQEGTSQGLMSWNKVEDSVLVASYELGLNPGDTTFIIVNEIPVPIGGLRGFYMGIQKSLRYPAEARRRGVQGKVFVQFIVNREGKVEEVETVKGIGYGCDIAAEKAVGESDRWKPGEFEGKKVKVRMILPITFKLG